MTFRQQAIAMHRAAFAAYLYAGDAHATRLSRWPDQRRRAWREVEWCNLLCALQSLEGS